MSCDGDRKWLVIAIVGLERVSSKDSYSGWGTVRTSRTYTLLQEVKSMYANTSKPYNFELNATVAELQGIEDYPRQTWWNRSAGPLVLTAVLAPVVLPVMGAGYLFLEATIGLIRVTEQLPVFSSAE
ncbi:MAG: hypothetical protein AAGE92_00290 [Cyanobacteria bacterium P01_G01_bin.4]